MWSRLEFSLSYIPLGALNYEFCPRVDPTKKQGDLLFYVLVIGYGLFSPLTLGLGADLHYLLGEGPSL